VAYLNVIFLQRDWGKPRKISDRIAGHRAEIWNLDLPNTTQEGLKFLL